MNFLEKLKNKVNSKIDYAKVTEKTELDMVFNDKVEKFKSIFYQNTISLIKFEDILYYSSNEMLHEDEDTRTVNNRFLEFIGEINDFMIIECLNFISDQKKSSSEKDDVVKYITSAPTLLSFFLQKERSLETVNLIKNINENRFEYNLIGKLLLQAYISNEFYANKDFEHNDDQLFPVQRRKGFSFRKNKKYYGNNSEAIQKNIEKFYEESFEKFKENNSKEQNIAVNQRNLSKLEYMLENLNRDIAFIKSENRLLFSDENLVNKSVENYLEIFIDLLNKNVFNHSKINKAECANLMRIKSFKDEENSIEVCFNPIHLYYYGGCNKHEKSRLMDFLFEVFNNEENQKLINNNYYQFILTKNQRKNEVFLIKFNKDMNQETKIKFFNAIQDTLGKWLLNVMGDKTIKNIYESRGFSLPPQRVEIKMMLRELSLNCNLLDVEKKEIIKRKKI